MQTDMSPIDDSYDPVPPLMQQQPARQQFFQEEDTPRQSYFQPSPPPQYYMPQQQQMFHAPTPEKGFFAQFDKVTWIIIGLLVLIAFFMGKTMQPVFVKA
jgi:hypothetical protein